jgi:hypothetical protein
VRRALHPDAAPRRNRLAGRLEIGNETQRMLLPDRAFRTYKEQLGKPAAPIAVHRRSSDIRHCSVHLVVDGICEPSTDFHYRKRLEALSRA